MQTTFITSSQIHLGNTGNTLLIGHNDIKHHVITNPADWTPVRECHHRTSTSSTQTEHKQRTEALPSPDIEVTRTPQSLDDDDSWIPGIQSDPEIKMETSQHLNMDKCFKYHNRYLPRIPQQTIPGLLRSGTSLTSKVGT
jgi:hypothetical protein